MVKNMETSKAPIFQIECFMTIDYSVLRYKHLKALALYKAILYFEP